MFLHPRLAHGELRLVKFEVFGVPCVDEANTFIVSYELNQNAIDGCSVKVFFPDLLLESFGELIHMLGKDLGVFVWFQLLLEEGEALGFFTLVLLDESFHTSFDTVSSKLKLYPISIAQVSLGV